MTKVINPFFPEGISCLRYRPRKNLKSGFAHVALIAKYKKKKKGGDKND